MSADEIQSIRDSLHRIEQSLMGDPKMGNRGLVSRIESLESQQGLTEKKLLVWGGIITGASIVITHFKTKILG